MNGQYLVEKGEPESLTTRLARWRHSPLLIVLVVLALLLLVLALVSGTVLYLQYLPYKRRAESVERPCDKMFCAYGAQCLVDQRTQQAYCRCRHTTCSDLFAPVCGSDEVTYSSECEVRITSCTQQRRIFVRHQGHCNVRDPCQDKECHFGAECRTSLDGRTAECVCPDKCTTYGDSHGSRPACGTDGKDYPNVCELRRSSCKEMRDVKVKFHGRCDPCEGVECPSSQICQLDDNRNPICRCNAVCSSDLRPVCGSDGKTYSNECTLRVEACKSRRNIRIIYTGECSSGVNPCENIQCGPGQECDIDRYGIATCQCPPDCEPVMRLVCGSDGQTYYNDCELKRQACLLRQTITVAYRGECGQKGPCYNYHCSHGALCIVKNGQASCECPTCSEEFEPVCGNDGISYTNICQLNREACERRTDITVASQGLCNKCENVKCEFYSVCEGGEKGAPKCVCPETCVNVEATVCGSDGVTYENECELRVGACKKQEYVVVASKGACDLCQNIFCKYGARCENGQCVCPTDCPDTYEAICAEDGATYQNECELRRQSCLQSQDLSALFYGECEEAGGSGLADLGSGTRACDTMVCNFGASCEYDEEGLPQCVCDFHCGDLREPVCGSDGRPYDSTCHLRREGCRQQVDIQIMDFEMCKNGDIFLCNGELPLMDPDTEKEYDCKGPQECPFNSYCVKTPSMSRCCREASVIKTCAMTSFGCCPDGKTIAQGRDHSGCPSNCNCNRLGAFSQTCDPVTKQCPCKPGVGGLRCDRCEPGFWGLHKIADDGNSGCIPCACNLYGSVRDDCEQMTGRCVCKHGIHGMKCDVCPTGTVLGPDGCMDASIATAVPGSCDQLQCYHGATCKEKGDEAQCVCDFKCLPENSYSMVCGSDGNTYGSECQLMMFACRYQRSINVTDIGPCKRILGIIPTSGPVRRSTIQKVTEQDENKSIRDITIGLSSGHFQSSQPTAATEIVDSPRHLKMPSFSGRSFLELPRLQVSTRLSLEVEFRSLTTNGILLFNGQKGNDAEDFVSLAVKDGFVEFRYNLGSGTVALRSVQRVQPGRFHHVVAKRYLQDGLLMLDGQEESLGRSLGMLKSLDLSDNLFVGYVPKQNSRVFDNIGVSTGLVGCVRRLKIGPSEIDLRFPVSDDIIRAVEIRECIDSQCSSMPCQNNGICMDEGDTYNCICFPGFTSTLCEVALDPCSRVSCGQGATCSYTPLTGVSCLCPAGRTGRLCDEVPTGVSITPIADFDGQSFLELPIVLAGRQQLDIEVWFLTRSPDGAILHTGPHLPDFEGVFSLLLEDGYLQLFDESEKRAVVTMPQYITLDGWHDVKMRRLVDSVSLQLDSGPIETAEIQPYDEDSFRKQTLYLGGAPPVGRVYADEEDSSPGLNGAIQRLVVNGETWSDLVGRSSNSHSIHNYQGPPCPVSCLNGGTCVPQLGDSLCWCPPQYMGKKCEGYIRGEKKHPPVSFNGKEMHNLSVPVTRSADPSDLYLQLKFRTNRPNGLLLWISSPTVEGAFLGLAVVHGQMEFAFRPSGAFESTIVRSSVRAGDGFWHTATARRNKRIGILQVDEGPSLVGVAPLEKSELNSSYIWMIGGSPNVPSDLQPAYFHKFSGCIGSLVIDGTAVPLDRHRTDSGLCEGF